MIKKIARFFEEELIMNKLVFNKGASLPWVQSYWGITKEKTDVIVTLVNEEKDLWVSEVDTRGNSLTKEEKMLLFIDFICTLEHEEGEFKKIGRVLHPSKTKFTGPDSKTRTLNDWKEEREQARLAFTYYEKHKDTRSRIDQFAMGVAASPGTQRSHRYSLELFFEFLIINHFDTYPHYDEEIINEFIRYIYVEKGSSIFYVHRLLSSIFSFSSKIGLKIEREKAIKSDLPKVPDLKDIEPETITPMTLKNAEMTLKNELANNESRARVNGEFRNAMRDKWRNLLIFRLCLDGCLTISEVVSLTFSGVIVKKNKTPYLEVKGRGESVRQVPVPKYLINDLVEYIKFRKKYDLQISIDKEMRHIINGRKTIQDFYLKEEEISQYELVSEEFNRAISERNRIKVELKNKELNNAEKEKLRSSLYKAIGDSQDAYEEWVGFVRAIVGRDVKSTFTQNESLFVSNRYRKVALNTVQVMLQNIGREKYEDEWITGLYGVSSQQLRHTGIKLLVENGVPSHKIRTILGQNSADVTLRYSKGNLENSSEALENLRDR